MYVDKYRPMLAGKTLPDSLVANEAAVSVVQVTCSQSLIECEQVQMVQLKVYHFVIRYHR